jgi:glycosyltransferase involved in cell wall biosynthesis
MQLSVVIITFNEEANIARCIESVKQVADDIVIVDSYSSDATEKIVKESGARFVHHEFHGHIEQKNWAITQARFPWVLSLDADEALDETLSDEIRRIKAGPAADAYSMNRMTNYCGHWVKHGGWYPDVKLRLWDSTKGMWGGTNPHDKFEMQPGSVIEHLEGNILHYSFRTVEQHDKQIAYFTDISAKALAAKGKHSGPFRGVISAVAKFIRDYLLRLGFLDGATGWRIATKSAYAKYLKYTKLRALQRTS